MSRPILAGHRLVASMACIAQRVLDFVAEYMTPAEMAEYATILHEAGSRFDAIAGERYRQNGGAT